jgi:hypothetical protein
MWLELVEGSEKVQRGFREGSIGARFNKFKVHGVQGSIGSRFTDW